MYLLRSTVCVSKPDVFFLCAIELHFCPKTIENTSVSHTIALGDMFLHYHEHTLCSLFFPNPTNNILLPQILTRAPNVNLSGAKTSPHPLLSPVCLLKITATSCFGIFQRVNKNKRYTGFMSCF